VLQFFARCRADVAAAHGFSEGEHALAFAGNEGAYVYAVDEEGFGRRGAERGVEHGASLGFIDGGPAELGAESLGYSAFVEELAQ